MGLRNYGVLKGRPIEKRLGAGQSPHYQVRVVGGTTHFRIAVNVKSKLSPSELLYLVEEDFQHPILGDLEEFAPGFTEIRRAPGGAALDYIRANLFDRTHMVPLPYNVPGPDNDLNEKLDRVIQLAMAEEDAEVYAFGERWGPEAGESDKYFGFLPGNGIHDIHMNQGNVGRFIETDGVWQDGGLLIHFPSDNRWIGVFLAFQSQSWHTDDRTGHSLGDFPRPDEPERPGPPDPEGLVRIVGALVNPPGHDPRKESVTLINTTPQTIDLNGWALADKNKRKESLTGPALGPGETAQITLSGEGAQLSNKGGILTLLDTDGLKVHGVSYTRKDARREGWTLVF